MIRLTDEEIRNAQWGSDMAFEDMCHAQLKKVVEWGDEECGEHSHRMTLSRRMCPECWQTLLEEVQ